MQGQFILKALISRREVSAHLSWSCNLVHKKCFPSHLKSCSVSDSATELWCNGHAAESQLFFSALSLQTPLTLCDRDALFTAFIQFLHNMAVIHVRCFTLYRNNGNYGAATKLMLCEGLSNALKQNKKTKQTAITSDLFALEKKTTIIVRELFSNRQTSIIAAISGLSLKLFSLMFAIKPQSKHNCMIIAENKY